MSLKTVVGRDIRLRLPPQVLVNVRVTSFHRPRRSKRSTYLNLVIRSSNHQLSSSSYDNLFHAFLSQLDLLTPALGFTTALAVLYKSSSSRHLGDWTLFTSPTPFNRFVKLRCASLLLEDSNEKLVDEDGHVVSLDTGRIHVNHYTDDHVLVKQFSYQRICVNTDDGGVVSLDWPANLELTKEHGLDTTILIVPGNTDGSMDENVRSFVYQCLKRGCFPIVMNPRGCARSPLTTPRLFTAADSDDICTTVQFINRVRPWTTLMGVGFGYGANMLTKYLAEVGEETPLTAATCLDNPFDLKGAANHLSVDQNLTSGLINMLQSNKELFQGRSKGFDVEKALQAKSLKDFEEAISMVSYGFDSIQEFYVSSSTRDVVGNVKIPLLFIQSNAMPSFSIPHSLIAENHFTSLLICTFRSDDKSTTSVSSWCQHLVVEWLTAVELGLLKGRHPLLEDTDVTINPSKRLKLMAGSRSSNNLLNIHQLDGNTWKRSGGEYVNSSSGLVDLQGKNKDTTTNGTLTLVDLKEGDADSERGQMLQATQVVMNMLDVTMPEALSEEQKLKVLTAVSQGETLINALQDAVPEDVRGKLTSSVSAILQNQKENLNGAALNTKMMQERSRGLSKEPDATELNTTSLTQQQEEGSNNHPSSKSDGLSKPEAHTLENSDELQLSSHQGGEISNSGTTSHDQLGSDNQSDVFSKEKANQFHDSDSSAISSKMERSEDHISFHEGGTNVDNQQKEDKDAQLSTDISTPQRTEETSSPSSTPPPEMAKEDGENQKKGESIAQPPPPVPSCNSPSFSVSQALDALTGMDDSTQVAVNSVFSVIEDVITQLEGNRDNESAATDDDGDNNTSTDSAGLPHKEGDEKCSMTTELLKESGNHQQSISISKLSTDEANNNHDDIRHFLTKLQYRNSLYDHYIQSHLLSKMKNDKLPQSDALYLDYVPEEGQWKLLEQSGYGRNYVDDATSHEEGIKINVECNNDIIEPTYVILDAEGDWDPVGEYKKIGHTKEKLELVGGDDDALLQLMQLVKENILKSLEVEVSRRIQAIDMVDIAPVLKKELEHVANTFSLAVVVQHDKQHVISWDGEKLVGLGNLKDEHVIDAISSAVQGTRYMKQVLPIGIVVGSSLASLRKLFNINAAGSTEAAIRDHFQKGYHLQPDRMAAAADDEIPLDKVNQNNNLYSEDDGYDVSTTLSSDTVMVGAVTAALGASALLLHQQNSYSEGLERSTNSSIMSLNQEENDEEPGKVEEETSKSGDNNNNIVTSLAEKAMLVAGPVVPTKEDGGVDQERLVALLADLGQKGGILKLVGKVALLWGGIRGAMSLTGKLISFLRLAERPLFHRILGFVLMVLVLWTPVVVPLLPTLVQNWASHNSSKYAELACIIGLYSSIMILIVLWGKRIRGYEDPLERYGLELTSAKQIQNFVCGLIGGATLVLLVQYTNVLLGFVCISWPSFTDGVTLLNFLGKVVRFVGQGLVTTTAVALVEELLFRSWLPEEIALDLGYHQGIILSGLAFSLSQWSLKAIPGVWLLSVGLAGVRQRCKGKLSLPIGLRAGIMASTFVLKEGGVLINQQHSTTISYPLWVNGDPFQPFNSIIGLAVAFLWAAILYPRNPQNQKGNNIKE